MVITRRSSEENTIKGETRVLGGIGVLERPNTYEDFVADKPAKEVNLEAEQALRRKNLENLLNYDRYSAQMEEEQVVSEVEEVQEVSAVLSDEDIRPTSTTMQFGEDIDQIRHEINERKSSEQVSARLNNRGKLAVTLYALVVTVILALIVLNTGVLAKLSNINQAKAVELNETIAKYNALQEEIASISNSDYIVDVAQNEFGMIR
ncbi:MAG: hypothetical protein E7373_05255 [Clostridiales bacterium]|nr:hypothetical protein [Clostridiales bacterium]